MLRKLTFFVPIFFLLFVVISCSDDVKETEHLVDAYSIPKVHPLDTSNGYKINAHTGDSIKPLFDFFGDTLISGRPIKMFGEIRPSNTLEEPIVVKAGQPVVVPVKSGLNKVPESHVAVPVDKTLLTTIEFGKGDSSLVIVNSIGDTIPTGVFIEAKGKVLKLNLSTSVLAQPMRMKDNANGNFQYLDVDQGLTSSYVHSVMQDNKGYMWFGTNGGGAVRYDGSTFLKFGKEQGLLSNEISSIFQDSKGIIWFGTRGAGVISYDGETLINYNDLSGLSSNTILSISETKNGDIWFGTTQGGASKLTVRKSDGKKGFIHYTTKEGLSLNIVWKVLEDIEGNLWFATYGGGVSKFDQQKFTHYKTIEDNYLNYTRDVFEDSKGNIWFSTLGGLIKLMNVNAQNEQTITYTENDGLPFSHMTSVIEDNTNSLWVGTNGGGFCKMTMNENDVLVSFTCFGEAQGFSSNYVRAMMQDNNGNLWFGTDGGGVNKYNPNSPENYSINEGLPESIVLSIFQDSQGNHWFGTSGGGLVKYNGENFICYNKEQGLSYQNVGSIIEDKSNDLWFGTYHQGVTRYDGKNFSHYEYPQGIASRELNVVFKDSKGNLWFGTADSGATKYQCATETNDEIFTHYGKEEGLSSSRILCFMEDRHGNIWFGTQGGGCSKFDGEHITHYTEKEGLSSNNVGTICEDESGNIWIGTNGGGVNVFDGKEFTCYTDKEGLSNNIIWSIVQDNKGIMWITTENGITYLVKDTLASTSNTEEKQINEYKLYTLLKLDGLKGLDFYRNSAYIDNENKVWWGSGKSLTMLDLNKYKIPNTAPVVYFKSLDINEKFIDYRNASDSLLDGIEYDSVAVFENYPLNLVLPYNKNHLTFYFSAIDWAAPHKIQYSYRLEGLNVNWSTPSSDAKADYRNLPYGDYTFQVKAISVAQVWSEPFEYSFSISPPWWHTWWFRVTMSLLFISLLFILYRWRTASLRQRQVELEKTVEERTAEVVAEKKEVEKQKENAEHQKELVQEKNKEITDSINYAKRIQEAILPSRTSLVENLQNGFVLFKPKDVVSGDFYWLEKFDDTVFFAAADCTGHGVPGAMVSVVCSNAISKALLEDGVTETGKLLDRTRELVIERFARSEDEVKDGMDISLCAFQFNTETNAGAKLNWSGANNPLWIIRHGSSELEEIKADKQPIGKYGEPKPFTTHSFDLKKGDSIYIFTDGFQDQFGGEKGKKFKASKMKEILISIQDKSMDEQKKILDDSLENWRGSLEQVDDVCVIGVRV